MMTTGFAQENDIEQIRNIDRTVIGNDGRFGIIDEYVKKGKCIVAVEDGPVLGYLLFDRIFFDHNFIELLIVDLKQRRKGIGLALLRKYEETAGPGKIFTSTNRSNRVMQKFLKRAGYRRSGIIRNLDEGDPELVYFRKPG